MKKIIYRIILILFLIIFSLITYLSLIGIETNKFNNQIEKKIKNFSKDIEIELKEIKLILDPLNFQFNSKTLGPKIKSGNQVLDLESIQTQVSLFSIFKDSFPLKNLDISTKTIEVRKLISFIRSINRDPKLLVLENFIKQGYLIADIKLEFDLNGKIKKNYEIKGFVKNGKIDFLKKYKFEKINFNFEIGKENSNFQEISFLYKDLDLFFEKITTQKIADELFFNGKIINKNLVIKENFLNEFIDYTYFKIKKINLDSESDFSFNLDKRLKIKDLKIKSKIKLNEAEFTNNLSLESFFPKAKNQSKFLNHELEIDYTKNEFKIIGNGEILIQNNNDNVIYTFIKKNKKFTFDTSLIINNNEFLINFLNYKKKDKDKLNISFKGSKDLNDKIKIDYIHFKNKKDKIEFKNLILDQNYKVLRLQKARFDYSDKENQINKFNVINKKNNYFLNGDKFNANYLLDNLTGSDDKRKLNIFKEIIDLKIKLNDVRLDEEYNIKNLNGDLVLSNNNIINGNLNAFFSNKEKIKFTVTSKNNEKITTLFSDKAKPFVKRYKFIKGFSNGSLDFYSIKKNNIAESNLKIYDFKLKEVPALTKLLTLASLQGIADLLSGEGIRFNEFEMKFQNKDSLITINEIYALGPAISILMDGYIEKNKLVSLRGTLVPATTINKVIGSIPILGQILVGSKTGEGVFGVSYKIKGPPKKLETTVNPIKTLTPRFITRTLEKIKKN